MSEIQSITDTQTRETFHPQAFHFRELAKDLIQYIEGLALSEEDDTIRQDVLKDVKERMKE